MRTAPLLLACLLTAAAGAQRFPQPVRVGDLLHRAVLRPVASQDVLGHVRQVVRIADGTLEIVVQYGGLAGIGGRPIAVPADAMALVGDVLEVIDLKPAQLDALPTFQPGQAAPVPASETVRIGLAGPAH